ncbi:NADH:flavin oxidoreductase/NADH oxidase [soil metagenome]
MHKTNNRPLLFTPLQVRGVTLPNRIMVSPMCQYSSTEGFATDWHLVHLGARAAGGAGIVMTETAAVERDGRISPWDLGIWDDVHIDMLSRITAFMNEQGTISAIQIGHAGRKASQRRPWDGGGPLRQDESLWTTVAPSAIAFDDSWPKPQEMSLADIQRVVGAFRAAARRAREAGFIVIEIHAAHGYLLNAFLSEHSNTRTDTYGGSFENRLRFPCEVVAAVREEWPDDYPVSVRISATDWADGGWGIDESIALVRAFQGLGVDIIDVSSGGNRAGVTVPSEPGYQVPLAEQIRQETGVTTAAVGLITDPEHAEAILQQEQADIIALGREFLRNPYWPLEAAAELGLDLEWLPQYRRAKP